MKYFKILSVILCSILVFSSCGKPDSDNLTADTETTTESNSITENTVVSNEDMFSKRDAKTDYDNESAISVKLNGTTASCENDSVKIDGSTITITDEGTYVFSGTLSDGMIVVDADETDKPQMILDGVSVTNETCAPLYILNADKVFITLAEGSENTLSNGGEFKAIDDNSIDATVFSKQDLTFNGSGSLTVTSPAEHGIVCKDDLVFTGGTYTVSSASHGLDANDSIRIKDTSLTITSGKDGIHTENSDDSSKGFFYMESGKIDVEAEGDGISAEAYAQITDGNIDILAGGGSVNGTKANSDSWGSFGGHGGGMMGGHGGMGQKPDRKPTGMSLSDTTDTPPTDSEESMSMKGIKSAGNLVVEKGNFKINSADDSIHTNSSLTLNGGTFEITSGDDGIHAEEKLNITNGAISITESYEGLEALDIAISGGDISLIATDDGLNAAGGTDSSGMGGRDNGMFGGGGPGGMMGGSSNGSIVISGGKLHINASGDGIDANGSLEISGGYTVVTGPTIGDTATLDYDSSAVISGGTFIGTGAAGMAQTFSNSENQGVISLSAGTQNANTSITVKNTLGKSIVTFSPELSFSVVIISTPEIQKGETYKISIGSESAEIQAE
ncbi:MAG: carbohydrate-binding domain-containing protein [Ruminococcaceae bacterium]|nr:carbohydrate-binding domain-containing protein [Oscillospiraceae bacterium]